jgi:hypothetical protein
MNRNSLNQNDIDTIKDLFSREFLDGKKPTLASYIAKYPEWTDELTDFILSFAMLHAEPVSEFETSAEAEAAMRRGLSASQSLARSIADRMSEVGLTEAEFCTRVRAPMEIFALFHRNHVLGGAKKFYRAVAKALSLSELQSRRLLAPQALALKASKKPDVTPKTFGDILDELMKHQIISSEDYAYWKSQETEE